MIGFADIWRILLLLLNTVCILILLDRFRRHHKIWASITRDYWWTLLLWSLAGIVVALQGLLQSRPASLALLFITIANFATPIGLSRKNTERGHTQIL